MKKKRLKILAICVILLIGGIFSAKIIAKKNALYKVTYLPNLGYKFTLPFAINDNGQIAGTSRLTKRDTHLFLWDQQSGMQDIGANRFINISLNNAGQIASSGPDSNGNRRAFIWDPNTGRQLLPTLGGNTSLARDINNKGQVVGDSETASGVEHAFIWDTENGIRDLTPSSTDDTSARLINDNGQVVVYAEKQYLFVETDEMELEFTPIPNGVNMDINNEGYVFCVVRNEQDFDIFSWHPVYGKNDISHIKNKLWGIIYANDINQVIVPEVSRTVMLLNKQIFPSLTKNYLYDPNLGKISLDEYVPLGWGESFFIMGMNNKGQIVGAVQSEKNDSSRGVLLEPVEANFKKLQAKRKKQEEK